MAKLGFRRVNGGHDARRSRPATGHGQPLATCKRCQPEGSGTECSCFVTVNGPGFGGMMVMIMGNLNASPTTREIPAEWLADFEAAARRPLATRMRYAFIKTYKPVLDDATYRSWETMSEYRAWCERELPDWLGYGRVRVPPG